MIVARGGGSIEDLWSFNEEEVVRAISESSIPLISAIGHETDMSLSDFAADKRAPTPTAAAEIAVPVRAELIGYINDLNGRKYTGALRNISSLRDRLRAVSAGLPGVDDLVAQDRQRLDLAVAKLGAALNAARQTKALGLAKIAPRLSSLVLKNMFEDHKKRILAAGQRSAIALLNRTKNSRLQMMPISNRLGPAITLKIRDKHRELKTSSQLLNSLGYRNVLERGFVLVMDKNQQVVKKAKNLSAGDNVTLRFADSERGAIIEGATTEAGGEKKIKKPTVAKPSNHPQNLITAKPVCFDQNWF
ncbi:Exodeoxyribonuclease VII large subunit [hydrothermal vent metagenome]|uniref:Exodeoxyribonuclease VII large subunit n=1 Tax=hydrothermal vent metagenome TaxID=652676 RepID=A0A3B0ULB0_9ZZZZ